MKRILVIRGGAIGDFILTLPALRAIREAHPQSWIEILGYKHIAAVADQRFYAQAVQSIEYGPLSGFFAKNASLPAELCDYFASFDMIVSYLYDSDRILEENLRKSGARKIVTGPAKIDESESAARQLARPVEQLGLTIRSFSPKIFPSEEDREFANDFLADLPRPILAIHPGSGSRRKNWPVRNWRALAEQMLTTSNAPSVLIVSGEADEIELEQLESLRGDKRVRFAKNLPLPLLAAVLEQTVFVGHDSGVSHLAAATGAPCVLLFGPTEPRIWAPIGDNVAILSSPTKKMEDIGINTVLTALMNWREPVEKPPASK